jgi:hypothetical protein
LPIKVAGNGDGSLFASGHSVNGQGRSYLHIAASKDSSMSCGKGNGINIYGGARPEL